MLACSAEFLSPIGNLALAILCGSISKYSWPTNNGGVLEV